VILERSEPTARLTRRSLLLSTASAVALVATPGAGAWSIALAAQTPAAGGGGFLDPSLVHDIVATFDQDAYDTMVQTYAETGDKEWISATLTIDGQTFEQVGLRLKGNSSLMGLREGNLGGDLGDSSTFAQVADSSTSATPAAGATPITGQTGMNVDGGPNIEIHGGPTNLSADEPQGLPWLVHLDRNIDGQSLNGLTEFVIRSNGWETALNEALSLDLLAEAGLASQQAAYIRFTANDSDPRLRLAIENPDGTWLTRHFADDGILFKSEAQGNWSYRDENYESYTESFDLEAGGTDDDAADYAHLIDFLDFLTNSDDATFARDLPKRLDVDQFAVYLAMMDLLGNDDDIDGPGNNSYLFFDTETGVVTIVPWDMNLSFQGPGFGGPENVGPGGEQALPAPGENRVITIGGTPVPGQEGTGPGVAGPGPQGEGGPHVQTGDGSAGGFMLGPGGMSNPLVQRWAEVEAFTTLQSDASARLESDLFKSGVAADILSRWVDILETHASDLVDQSTIEKDASSLEEMIGTE
jgi:spore coat protein CotH